MGTSTNTIVAYHDKESSSGRCSYQCVWFSPTQWSELSLSSCHSPVPAMSGLCQSERLVPLVVEEGQSPKPGHVFHSQYRKNDMNNVPQRPPLSLPFDRVGGISLNHRLSHSLPAYLKLEMWLYRKGGR